MATIKIDFDSTGNPEFPTLVLAKRSGERIGLLDNLSSQHITDNLNSFFASHMPKQFLLIDHQFLFLRQK